MKSVLASITVFLSIILLSFFLVYSFHAQTPLQEEVKVFMDTGDGDLVFSPQANSHMLDVFVNLSWARVITSLLIILTLWLLTSVTKQGLQVVGYSLGLIVLVSASLPWRVFDTVFHNIFFPQGNWMFSYNSLLIQTYPTQYFVFWAGIWGSVIVLCAISCIALSQKLPAFLQD